MKKSIIGLAFMLAVGWCHAGQKVVKNISGTRITVEDVSDSKYGIFQIVSYEEKGKYVNYLTLDPSGSTYINNQYFDQVIEGVAWSDSVDVRKSEYFLIGLREAGLQCKKNYVLIDVRGDRPMFSTKFGNCSDLRPEIKKLPSGAVEFVFHADEDLGQSSARFEYKDGIFKRN